MASRIKWRGILAVLIALAGLFYLTPSLTDRLPDFWKSYLPHDKIHLGLDLQGGMHLVLEVDTEKAMENALTRAGSDLKDVLMERNIRFRAFAVHEGKTVSLELPGREEGDAFRKLLGDLFRNLEIESSDFADGKETVTLRFRKADADDIRKFAIDQSLETIRNRIDQFGVTEPEIVPQGTDRILVQLPGIKDPRRAINLIGKTALLEFHLVDEEGSLDEALKGNIPEGSAVYYGTVMNRQTGQRVRTPYLLKSKAALTGDALENATVKISDRFGEPYVGLKFNSQGARDFERITGENVKRRLAIVLDGVVHSAPVIQEKIAGGEAQITGTFTMDEARDLAIVLRAGALPAPVKILEQRTVGPSLGQDSIEKGFLSIIVGGIFVVFFMILYYRVAGLIANVALILNVILIMAVLAAFGATLTLPGIAGIVLTIGMAVDANVLIFERIREETRVGKSASAAVAAGYSRALTTIIDANVTTLIAAVVLFQFGTGPVKGFAVTLSIGILCSMFTAIFVTRIFFDYLLWFRKIKTVSI